MDKRAISYKHKKILKHINEKYELQFETIVFKDSVFLLGIRADRSIWIYMDAGELKIEESFFAKGARYKRKQQMKDFELNEDKYQAIEKQMEHFLLSLKQKLKKEKIKQLFGGEMKNQFATNENMIRFMQYVVTNKKEEMEENQPLELSHISKCLEGTDYESIERFVPLLQGVERHKKYQSTTTEKAENRTYISILKTASNKVIYFNPETERVEVFETEEDFRKKCQG